MNGRKKKIRNGVGLCHGCLLDFDSPRGPLLVNQSLRSYLQSPPLMCGAICVFFPIPSARTI